MDGDFEDDIIKGFLESIKKESSRVEPTDIPPQQYQEYLDHFVEDELSEYPLISKILVSHNENDESDQVESVEDAIIDEFLEVIGDEGSFFSGSGHT